MATATKTRAKSKAIQTVPAQPTVPAASDLDVQLERAIRLRDQREAIGMTQAEVSAAMGISLADYDAAENGERSVGPMWISVFAFAANVRPDALDSWFLGKPYRLRPTRKP